MVAWTAGLASCETPMGPSPESSAVSRLEACGIWGLRIYLRILRIYPRIKSNSTLQLAGLYRCSPTGCARFPGYQFIVQAEGG